MPWAGCPWGHKCPEDKGIAQKISALDVPGLGTGNLTPALGTRKSGFGQGNQGLDKEISVWIMKSVFGCLFFMSVDLKGLWVNSWVQWGLHICPPAAFFLYSSLIRGEGQGNNLLFLYETNKWIPSTDCRKWVPKIIWINLKSMIDLGTARRATSCWNGPSWGVN